MKITDIKTYLVGNPWKNWLFVQMFTDEGTYGIGEGSLGHLSKTVEAAIHEMRPFILGLDIFQTELLVGRLSRNVYADGGQIKMCAIPTPTVGTAASAHLKPLRMRLGRP